MNEKQSGFKFVPVYLFIYSKDQGCHNTLLHNNRYENTKVHAGTRPGNISKESLDCGVYFIMLKNKILFKNSKNGDHALLSSCTILAYYKHLNFVSSKSVIHFNKFRSYLSCLQFNFRYSTME